MPWRLIDPATNPRARQVAHIIAGLSIGLLLVGGVTAVTVGVFLIDAVRDTQVSNTQRAAADRERDEQTAATARDAAAAAERIEDCTTPGRPCFEDQLKRTGAAVTGINEGTLAVIAAALSCQEDGLTEQRQLARCTAERAAASTVGGQSQQRGTP